jgi:ketosteroid isomerase-like protein
MFVACAACAGAPILPVQSVDVAKERALLMRVDAEFSRLSVEKGAQAAFAAYLAEDARWFPHGGFIVQGRDAIVAALAPAPGEKPNTLRWEPAGADVAASGELGYTFGHYEYETIGEGGAKVVKHGKYLTVWKRPPGAASWRIACDIGNSSP